jgi:protein tyrosine/serine phosphatase
MKKSILIFIGIIWSMMLSAQTADKIDVCGLKNMYRIDTDVYRSEQPDRIQFIALAEYGISEILNLRYWHSDANECRGINLTTHRVAMNAHDANDYDIVEALTIIRNRKGPILIHCHHGADRTGLIAAMYKIVFRGKSKCDVINEMINGGFGFHGIYINIIRYIERVDVSKIKRQINAMK